MIKTKAWWSIALLLTIPEIASAHLVSTRFGELYSGMLHPLTSLQHLVPWLALGLLAGLQLPATARWALVFFPAGVLAGLVAAYIFPGFTGLQAVNVASFIVVGASVAFRLTFRLRTFAAIMILFGFSHGYANAATDLFDYQWFLYVGGVGLVAYMTIALVAASVSVLSTYRAWGGIAVRTAGSWIAAAGLMYAGFLLKAV